MSEFRTTFFQEVTYSFFNEIKGEFILSNEDEPVGWKNDMPDIKWSNDYSGAITKYATDLEYVNGAADYLIDVYKTQGKNADVFLTKKKMHPFKIEEVTRYDNIRLDGNSLEIETKNGVKKVKINAVQGNLNTQLKAEQSEQIEVERLTTLDGQALTPLTKQKIRIDGKQLLLISDLPIDAENQSLIDQLGSNLGLKAIALPLTLVSSPDPRVGFVSSYTVPTDTGGFLAGDPGNLFYILNDRLKTLELDLNFNIDYSTSSLTIGASLALIVYDGGSSYNFNRVITLVNNTNQIGNLTYNNTLNVDLQEGESLGLIVYGFDGNFNGNMDLNLTFVGSNSLKITENSYFPSTQHDILLPFDLLNRILQIVLNRTDDVLISEALSSGGEYSLIGCAPIWWIRQFTEREFTTSFKDFFDSLKIVSAGIGEPLDMGIATIMDKEMVIVEKQSFFSQDVVAITLSDQILNVKRKTATKYILSSLDIGYEKGGTDYEDAGGLDEPMGRYSYNSPIDNIEKKLSLISKWSADPTRIELARRFPKESYPDRDTRYDEDNVFIDMKLEAGIYTPRIWSDDYAALPTNMFSPETYFNYRFLPSNLVIGFGRNLMSSLYPYTTLNLTFQSAIGLTKNEDGTSPTINSNPINRDIPISELSLPRHKDEEIEFEHKVNFNLIEQLEGTTIIDGREVPNIYCLAEITNEDGESEFVRIREIKADGNGKFKALTV